MKRKVVAFSLAVVLGGAMLAGCGSSSSTSTSGSGSSSAGAETSASAENTSSDKVYHIGICQLMEHNALDAATKGFEDELTKKLGKDHVEFDVENAQGEYANTATICNGFVSDKVDLIMANATGSLTAAVSATDSIPILGTSISDYGAALNMDDFDGTSGKNVSGTTDLAPIDEQEDTLVKLVPDAKKVGILYCSSEPNSISQARLFEKELKKDNISYEEYTAADSNEVQSVTTKATNECDALYIPTDNIMASSIENIKNVVVPAKIPAIVGEENLLSAGIATITIDYYSLGVQTADMAYDILVNGADISTMEVQKAKTTEKVYNKSNCEKMNITVPDDYSEWKES